MFCENSEIRKKLAKYLAERTAAENGQQNGETASRSRISAISEMRPKLGQIAVTERRGRPILGILRRRRDISRKIRNPRKIGEMSRKKNGGRKRATKRRNGFAESGPDLLGISHRTSGLRAYLVFYSISGILACWAFYAVTPLSGYFTQ